MRFVATALPGVTLIEPQPTHDDRGSFSRLYCADTFRRAGLTTGVVQINCARTHRRGTLRGLHYQHPPYGECKLLRCSRGRLFDVALDLRHDSPAYRRWVGVELSARNGRLLTIPPGCAHGYQVLDDDSEIWYAVSAPYTPAAEAGVRWDDPSFAIRWPLPVSAISTRDRSWNDWPHSAATCEGEPTDAAG